MKQGLNILFYFDRHIFLYKNHIHESLSPTVSLQREPGSGFKIVKYDKNTHLICELSQNKILCYKIEKLKQFHYPTTRISTEKIIFFPCNKRHGFHIRGQLERGSGRLRHYWGHLDSKASRHYYASIFLGRWPDACGHPSKYSVPHGKLL